MLYALAEAKKVGDGRFHILLSEPEARSRWGNSVQSFLAEYDAINWSLKVAEVYQCQAMAALAQLPDGCMAELEAYANRHIYQLA